VIIDAADPDEATSKASDYGKRDAAISSTDLVVDDQLGEIAFMGVRKLSEIWSLSESGEVQPSDLAEVTSSELEFSSYEDLLEFLRLTPVVLRYIN